MLYITDTVLPEAERGYIYFAEMTIDGDSFYKIGYSGNPLRRFRSEDFEDVCVDVEFKCLVPMMDWMYEDNRNSDYWELKLHGIIRRTNEEYQHPPEHYFSGYTECYKLTTEEFKAAVNCLEEWLCEIAPKGWSIEY